MCGDIYIYIKIYWLLIGSQNFSKNNSAHMLLSTKDMFCYVLYYAQ